MTTLIQDTVLAHLPTKKRTTSKGWVSFNAVCCSHNGESKDIRGRGGVITSPNGDVSYSCFNCNFKVKFVNGYALSYKFRKLLRWLGVDDLEIHRLNIEAMREQKRQEILGLVKPEVKKEELKVSFKTEPLPDEAVSFFGLVEFYELANSLAYPKGFCDAVDYVSHRKIIFKDYDLYWSPDTYAKMDKRVIVPFTFKGQIVGYTARTFVDGVKPKYIQKVDEGYVFNIDKQEHNWKFVIVCEGVFDAMSVDGVAVLKSDLTQQQVELIESLDREIIVVPDQNKSGQHLIDAALQHGWSVSFPVWAETCEDINDAVVKYGKLFTLKSIIDGVERSSLKIKLRRKQQYGK